MQIRIASGQAFPGQFLEFLGNHWPHSDIIHQKRITTKSWGQISSNNFDGLSILEYIDCRSDVICGFTVHEWGIGRT